MLEILIMPIYEYVCEECGHEVEVLQKISAPPLTKCSNCGKPSMKKKVSAAAFRLSGSGWYETDFKSGNKKNLKDNEAAKPKTDKAAKTSCCSGGACATPKSKD